MRKSKQCGERGKNGKDLWDPQEMGAGDREVCPGCSALELGMTLGD